MNDLVGVKFAAACELADVSLVRVKRENIQPADSVFGPDK